MLLIVDKNTTMELSIDERNAKPGAPIPTCDDYVNAYRALRLVGKLGGRRSKKALAADKARRCGNKKCSICKGAKP